MRPNGDTLPSRFGIATSQDEMSKGVLAWAVWAVVLSTPWLLPTHSTPWTTVYQELLIAAAMLPIAIWAVVSNRQPWHCDLLTAGVATVALVPLLQATMGLYRFPAEAPLVSLYLVGIAFTLALSRRAEEIAPGRLIDALFTSLLIAALVSTGFALAQWLSVDSLGNALAPMPFHDRPVANVGQPNNLGSLLVWGLIAVWWAHLKGRIGPTGAILAAAFLLVGVTLTQSRAGFLEVLLLGSTAIVGRRSLRTGPQAVAWCGLAVWFVACTLALDALTRSWTQQLIRPLLDTASPNERTVLLRMVLTAIAERPWFGYGWNQNVTAHVALAERFPMHGTVGNAHNLVLDLIVWNGLPLATALVGGLLLWCVHAARQLASAEDLLLALAIGTFGLHAMLELPHVLAYFLVPVAILMGTLNARMRLKTVFSVARAAAGATALALTAVLALIFIDYTRIESEGIDVAMNAAWPGTPVAPLAPRATVLVALQDGLRGLRTVPRTGMSAAELTQFRRAVTRYPTGSGLFRYAEATALNGRPDEAGWALRRLCSLHPVATCAAAAHDWSLLAAEAHPSMMSVVMPRPDASAP